MAWTVSAFSAVVFLSAAVALVVAVAALRERPERGALPLAVLMFAVVAWAVPHAVSLGYEAVESVVFWQRVRYPGTVLAPVVYLVVAVTYAGRERWLSSRTYAALAVVPVLTVVAVWTNPAHGLFWQSVSVVDIAGASVLVEEYGPLYWVNLGYLYLVTTAGLVLFADVVVHTGSVYRRQATAMAVGGAVPLLANVAFTVGLGPDPRIDPTAPALAVTGVTFALALFHLDLLEIRPVARDRLIEELDDGVVVVGPDGRIRDFNPTAKRVLDGIAVGQPAPEVLPADVAADGGELVAETAEGERMFRTRSTTLTDERGREVGRIFYLNDVTDLVKRDQRITVLNRILRHNVRNELTVALGHLDAVGGEDVARAAASIRRVNELAEKARTVERTLHSPEPEPVPVADVAGQVVDDAREEYPDAIIDYDPAPAGPGTASVAGEELLEGALVELVENAVVHNDADPPRVTVGVDGDEATVRVRVADNGPGIPAAEREAVAREFETQLEHGSGIGLWMVRWVATLSAGELSFSDNDPQGSVVAIEFPRPDADTA